MATPDEWLPPQQAVGLDAVPGPIDFAVAGRVTRMEIPQLCARVRAMAAKVASNPLVCDVSAVIEPDAATVDAFCRIQLTALRLGRRVQLRNASPQLSDLLGFMGLAGAVACEEPSGVEVRRQPEQREERLGVEEEADAGDHPA